MPIISRSQSKKRHLLFQTRTEFSTISSASTVVIGLFYFFQFVMGCSEMHAITDAGHVLVQSLTILIWCAFANVGYSWYWFFKENIQSSYIDFNSSSAVNRIVLNVERQQCLYHACAANVTLPTRNFLQCFHWTCENNKKAPSPLYFWRTSCDRSGIPCDDKNVTSKYSMFSALQCNHWLCNWFDAREQFLCDGYLLKRQRKGLNFKAMTHREFRRILWFALVS